MPDGTAGAGAATATSPPRSWRGAARSARRAAPWIVAAAGAGGLTYFAVPLALGPEVAAERIVRQDLTATIVASGRVLTPFRAQIGSQITGVVDSVPVAEGQEVRKGQLLIHLRSDDLQSAVEQADAGVAQAKARLIQMDQVVLPAARLSRLQTQATLANAQLTYDRMKRLTELDSIARADFDSAAHALDVAKAQDRAAALQVQTNAPDGADRRLAAAELASSEAAAAAARAKLAFADIRAPADGVLIARNVERGYVVAPGAVLMVLSPRAETQILINIDEKNLGRLAVGQPAWASADAYADQRFPVKVAYINPGVEASTAAVEVKLTAPQPPAYLRQDMTVSVDILSAFRKDVLVAPTDAVRQSPTGRSFVFVASRGRVESRPVRLGVRAGGRAEVLSGLAAGELVLPSTAKVNVGQRVRTKAHA